MEILEGNRIRVEANGQELVTDAIKLKECSSLVFTSYYLRSKLQMNLNRGVWFLYVDGKEVARKVWEHPKLFSGDFLQPTYIGGSEQGNSLFSAQLETPQFYNEFFYEEDTWDIGRGVEDLESDLCTERKKI